MCISYGGHGSTYENLEPAPWLSCLKVTPLIAVSRAETVISPAGSFPQFVIRFLISVHMCPF